MQIRADVMAGPIGDVDRNPNEIPRACPGCGMMADANATVCPNCGASLRRKAMKILAQGITEESINDLEKSLLDQGIEQGKVDEVLKSLKDLSNQENVPSDQMNDSSNNQNQNSSDIEIAEKGLENSMKPLKQMSRNQIRKSAVFAPDYDNTLEELLEKTDEILDTPEEEGWVVTPFSFGFQYQPQIDQSNSEAFYTDMQKRFPGDVSVADAYGSSGQYVTVRAFEDGEITSAGKALEEAMGVLTEYPVLDDEDYSGREYEAQMEFIRDLSPDDEYLNELLDSLSDEQRDKFYEELFSLLWDDLMTGEDMGEFSVSFYPKQPDIDSVFEVVFEKMGIGTEQLELPLRGASRNGKRAQRLEDLDEGLGRLEDALMGLGDLEEDAVLEEFGRPRRGRPQRKRDPNCQRTRRERAPRRGVVTGKGHERISSKIIPYRSDLDIRNLDILPRGVNARYLEVIEGLNGEYVAKQWRRKFVDGVTLIDMKGDVSRDAVWSEPDILSDRMSQQTTFEETDYSPFA